MAELSHDKLVKFLKGNRDASQKAAAEAQGLTVGQLSMLAFCLAKVEAGIYSKAPATGASVKKLRDVEENRWELIAARTGLSVSSVKEMYEDAGGKNLVGRVGGNGNGKAKAKPKATAKAKPSTKAAPKKPTGRQAAGRKTIVRNRNRRGASNPS
jgi:hypothetical protein